MSINDGKIYAAGLNKSFVLDAATGKHIQDYSTGGLAKPVKENFYMGKSDELLSISVKSGEVSWKFSIPTGDGLRTQPLIHNNLVYTCTSNGAISALDVISGERKWIFRVKEISPYSNYRISMSSGILYASDESLVNNNLYALDPATGDLLWQVLTNLNFDGIFQQFGPNSELVYQRTVSAIRAIDSKRAKRYGGRKYPRIHIWGISVFTIKHSWTSSQKMYS